MNIAIYVYTCDHVPDVVSVFSLPDGCVNAPAGIGFTVTDQMGALVGTCKTDGFGQCSVLAYSGEVLKIVEDPTTLPVGLSPGQSFTTWTVPTGGTDNVPVFINIPSPDGAAQAGADESLGATASPESPTKSATPPPSTATLAPARKVTSTATFLGDNKRSGQFHGDLPQGNIGVAASFSVSGLYDAELIVNGVLFGLSGDADLETVAAWDATTGASIWTLALPDGINAGLPAISSGTLYTALSDGTVLALAAGSGKQLWSVRGLPKGKTGVPGAPIVVDGSIYVMIGSYASGFNASTGKRLWAQLIGDVVPVLRPLASDTTLLFPVEEARDASKSLTLAIALEVDRTTGNTTWGGFSGYGDQYLGSKVQFASDETWVFGCFTDQYGDVYLVTEMIGANNSARVGSGCTSGVSVAPDGSIVYDEGGTISDVSPDLETEHWQADVPDSIGSAVGNPVIAGGLVLQSASGGVTALDPASGVIEWTIELPCTDVTGILSVQANRIYLTTSAGLLVLAGDAGPHKTTIHEPSKPAIQNGISVELTNDVSLLDDASSDAFPVVDLQAGAGLTVTGESVRAEGKTWWPVTDQSGDQGYVPSNDLKVTGCPNE